MRICTHCGNRTDTENRARLYMALKVYHPKDLENAIELLKFQLLASLKTKDFFTITSTRMADEHAYEVAVTTPRFYKPEVE